MEPLTEKKVFLSSGVASAAVLLGLPLPVVVVASGPMMWISVKVFIMTVHDWKRTSRAKKLMKANPRAVEEMRIALQKANPQFKRKEIDRLIENAFYADEK